MPSYFIRQNGVAVPQGPYPEAQIRAWAAQGRVRPDMDFSEDGERWIPGRKLISIFPPALTPAAAGGLGAVKAADREVASLRARKVTILALIALACVMGAGAWYAFRDKEKTPDDVLDAKPVVFLPAPAGSVDPAAAAKKAADERRDRDFAAAEAMLASGDLDGARSAVLRLRDELDDLRVADAMSRVNKAIEERDRAKAAEEAKLRAVADAAAAKKQAEERTAAEAAAKEKAARDAAEAKTRAEERARKSVEDLAARLRAAVAAGEASARDLWRSLRAQSKDDPALVETEAALGKLPYPAGTWIPSDARSPGGLRDHYSLPEADGLRVVVANGATIRLRVAASGVSASVERTEGKETVRGDERVIGLKGPPEKPEPVLVLSVRKRLGAKGPPADRYEGDVRWLPGDFVAFGSEVWNVAAGNNRGAYHAGTSTWADAFFTPTLVGPNAIDGINDRRTRIARGTDHYDAVAYLTDRTGVALAWLERGSLKGKALGVLPIATADGPSVPFEFVPWGKEKKPLLFAIGIGRAPVLVEVAADGIHDVVRGESIADGLSVGAPTWCDLGHRGVREIVAPAIDGQGVVGLLVLISE